MKTTTANYRILTQDRRVKYAGTDSPSWLTLEQAKKLVDYSKNERIYEFCKKTMEPCWEIL